MTNDSYLPTKQDRFSFGIWTVGWQGVDVFGGVTRPPMPAERAVYKLAELGAYGVNFHDNDVFEFGAGEESGAAKDVRAASVRGSARVSPCSPRDRGRTTITLSGRQAQRAGGSYGADPAEGSMMPSEPRLARHRVTLADVAAAAGVSVPTVSKVLNGHADVAPKTRSRVEALLADYNYAAPRRAGRPCLIDLVFADLSPWAVEIIRGAEDAASAEGGRIAVSVVSGEADTEQWLIRLSTSQTDGVILVLTELSPAYRARLAAMNMPVVIVDPVGQPDPRIPSIGATNWAGGLMATEHLIEIGHRRIGTITGRPSLLCSQARLDGYRAALERAGIPADPALVYPGDFQFEAALAAATDMVRLDDPPTAIFAGSDMQAMGVYEAARLHRLRIPDDLSVVGFDDLPMSGWVSPPLTTIIQPLAQMAAMATRTILTLLDGRADTSSNRVELTTSLVVRASTAPPRK